MFNTAAYLNRIGLSNQGAPSAEMLGALHEAHQQAVPFENLDIHRGVAISLNPDAIYAKIVEQHRGGFCYELNGLFAILLDNLGFAVTLLSARVTRADGSFGPEFDHLVLRVDLDQPWLVDVGFGDSFRRPLRLTPNAEQTDGLGRYRITTDGPNYVLQRHREDDDWSAQYAFSLTPRRLDEFEAMCIVQQTSPESHFTQRRMTTLPTSTGRITLVDTMLITSGPDGREERHLADEDEAQAVLRERFGICLPEQADGA